MLLDSSVLPTRQHHAKNRRQNETDAVVKGWNVHAALPRFSWALWALRGFMDLWFVFMTVLELFVLWPSGWLAKQCVRWYSQCNQFWVTTLLDDCKKRYQEVSLCIYLWNLVYQLKAWNIGSLQFTIFLFADWIFTIFSCEISSLSVQNRQVYCKKYNPSQDVFSFLHCSNPEVTFVECHSWIAGSHWVYWRRDSILCMHMSNKVKNMNNKT